MDVSHHHSSVHHKRTTIMWSMTGSAAAEASHRWTCVNSDLSLSSLKHGSVTSQTPERPTEKPHHIITTADVTCARPRDTDPRVDKKSTQMRINLEQSLCRHSNSLPVSNQSEASIFFSASPNSNRIIVPQKKKKNCLQVQWWGTLSSSPPLFITETGSAWWRGRRGGACEGGCGGGMFLARFVPQVSFHSQQSHENKER